MLHLCTRPAAVVFTFCGRKHKIAKKLGKLSAIALFCCFSSASTRHELPELGDTSSANVSPAIERIIGEDLLRQIRAQLPTVDDPILKYYTELHLYNLAVHSELKDKSLHPVLIDSSDINAFAAPGGVVGINAGLYLYAHDIHEFSSVLAHELAHLSQRHFARGVEMQKRQALPYVASLLGAILIAAAAGGEAGIAALSTAQAAAQMGHLRYSRSREQEADRLGIDTLSIAGLDPHGMERMFGRMQRAFRFNRQPPEFMLTHPVTESRIADARNQSAKFTEAKYSTSPEYQMMRARVQIHYAETPSDAIMLFRDQINRGERSEANYYGLTVALARAGRYTEALESANSLYKQKPESLLLAASYAEILIMAGKNQQAITMLNSWLTINPNNQPMSILLAKALSKEKRFDEAADILHSQSILHPTDHDVWYELAETTGLAGDVIGVHQARAEFFALVGNYRKAVEHLEYARGLANRGDFKLSAKLNQRIIDFQNEIRERSKS